MEERSIDKFEHNSIDLGSLVISLPGNDQEYVMRDHQPQYTNSIQN